MHISLHVCCKIHFVNVSAHFSKHRRTNEESRLTNMPLKQSFTAPSVPCPRLPLPPARSTTLSSFPPTLLCLPQSLTQSFTPTSEPPFSPYRLQNKPLSPPSRTVLFFSESFNAPLLILHAQEAYRPRYSLSTLSLRTPSIPLQSGHLSRLRKHILTFSPQKPVYLNSVPLTPTTSAVGDVLFSRPSQQPQPVL